MVTGIFVVADSFPSQLRNNLLKLGIPEVVFESLLKWTGSLEDYPRIPEAKGSISALQNEAFFLALYELYLTYGGIFRLTFGPKVCFLFTSFHLSLCCWHLTNRSCGYPAVLFNSFRSFNCKTYIEGQSKSLFEGKPNVARIFFLLSSYYRLGFMIKNNVSWFHLHNCNSRVNFFPLWQGILAEILDFVMGKGLIPADGEIWRRRRRAVVPALHQKVVFWPLHDFIHVSDLIASFLTWTTTFIYEREI